MQSDAALVEAVVKGHVAAFETLVTRYERSLCAVARAILRDQQLAEDVAQESFLAAYQALGGLRQAATFGPWLMQITRRNAIRMASRRPQLAAITEFPAPEKSELPVDQEQLLAAVMKLPEQERQVVMLRHFDGHDMAAMAEILGEAVGTVTKRLSRGHARLREMLPEMLKE